MSKSKSPDAVHVVWQARVMTAEHQLIDGQTLTIWEKGAQLELSAPLPVEQELLIEIMAQHSGETHRLLAKGEASASVVLSNNKGYGAHVRFTTVDPVAQKFLKSFVLAHDVSGKLNW